MSSCWTVKLKLLQLVFSKLMRLCAYHQPLILVLINTTHVTKLYGLSVGGRTFYKWCLWTKEMETDRIHIESNSDSTFYNILTRIYGYGFGFSYSLIQMQNRYRRFRFSSVSCLFSFYAAVTSNVMVIRGSSTMEAWSVCVIRDGPCCRNILVYAQCTKTKDMYIWWKMYRWNRIGSDLYEISFTASASTSAAGDRWQPVEWRS